MKSLNVPWARLNHNRYAIIQDRDLSSPPKSSTPPGLTSWSLSQVLLTIILCIASSLGSFTLCAFYDGRQRNVTDTNLMGALMPAGTLIKTFEFNNTYSAPPSKGSNRAWEENLPLGQGFMIEHTPISNISEFSVFHQLHCIDTIRRGYYAALANIDSTVVGEKNAMKNNHHVTHCFDFLRQCVECAADTNVEPVDWSLGGVTGWGFERVCRDFEKLKEHAEIWKVPGID